MSDKNEINKVLSKYNLTVESVFIPFSKSRNKDNKNLTLNWVITLLKDGRKIVSTEYSAGVAHCPSYNQGKMNYDLRKLLEFECENGKKAKQYYNMGVILAGSKEFIKPDFHSVVYSLLVDSEVLNHPNFESWADCFGYESDSSKHEQIYKACLTIALQFRQIGESVIEELREVFQDY